MESNILDPIEGGWRLGNPHFSSDSEEESEGWNFFVLKLVYKMKFLVINLILLVVFSKIAFHFLFL